MAVMRPPNTGQDTLETLYGLAMPVFTGIALAAVGRAPWWFWAAVVAPLIPMAFAAHKAVSRVRRDQRISEGRCGHCGYDLAGNVSGVCPECGAASA